MFAQVISGKVTDREGLARQVARWETDVRPGAVGFLGSTGGVTADGRFFVLARFESAEVAQRNSDRAEQRNWWAETEKCIDEVQFLDSSDIVLQFDGGSDDAGFVQVMRGRIVDAPAYDDVVARTTEFEALIREGRPEILGAVTIRHQDGRYDDVVYFTSEAAARQGESLEVPPELQKMFASMMAAAEIDEYLDLVDPWLH